MTKKKTTMIWATTLVFWAMLTYGAIVVNRMLESQGETSILNMMILLTTWSLLMFQGPNILWGVFATPSDCRDVTD